MHEHDFENIHEEFKNRSGDKELSASTFILTIMPQSDLNTIIKN